MTSEQIPKIHYFDTLDSTNLKLKELTKNETLPELSVVMARKQTKGRGQLGNSWESEAGKNLTFSILIKPLFIQIHQQFCITQLVTLALMDILKPLYNNVSIKWPNDIYADNKKMGGILIENNIKGNNINESFIGIGLNLNQTIFKSNAPNPISLCQLTKQNYQPVEIMKKFIQAFVSRYLTRIKTNNNDELKKDYLKHLYRKEGWYTYADKTGKFTACFHNIKQDGHLILKTKENELKTYAFKEVSYII